MPAGLPVPNRCRMPESATDLAPSSFCQPSSVPEKSQLRTSFMGPGAGNRWAANSVTTKLPSALRPGPLPASRSSVSASSRMPVTLSSGSGATMRYAPCALSPSTKIEPSACRANFARIGRAHFERLRADTSAFSSFGWLPIRQPFHQLLVVLGNRSLRLGDAFLPIFLGTRAAELGDFAVGFELGLQTDDAVLALDFLLGKLRAEFFFVGRQIRRRAWRFPAPAGRTCPRRP